LRVHFIKEAVAPVPVLTSDQFADYLRAALYRFDCPSPQAIGEYALNLLRDPERHQLAAHALACDECAEELRGLREFLATDPPVAERLPWRRVLAAFFPPAPGFAAGPVRGDPRGTSSEYHAGAVHIVLGTLPAHRRNTFALDGLVLHDLTPGAVACLDVRLLANDLPVQTTRTDELGNFAFDTVTAGTYQLEIEFVDEVLVIQNVTLAVRA
jgi:hypothetical protein